MPRRLIRNTSPQSLGNGEQAQLQGTSRGALKISAPDISVVTVNFTADTAAYASGDLICDATAIANAVDLQGGTAILDSITLNDESAQGVKLYMIFTTVSTTWGTLNSAPSITAANMRNVLGVVPILTTDYITSNGVKIACVRGLNLNLQAAAGTQTIYCAILNDTGTPTYTASALRAKFGLRQA